MSAPSRLPSCRFHCSACEEHFTSLVAFDRHRTVEEGCEDPRLVPGLAVQTRGGVCRIAPNDLEGVELWEAVPWRERALSRLRASRAL